MTKANFKKEAEKRIFLVCLIMVFCGVSVLGRTVYVNVTTDKSSIDKHTIKTDTIFGPRGDILADDNSLLSTTLTSFDAFVDINASGITNDIFKNNIDSLAFKLDSLFANRGNINSYKKLLNETRRRPNDHYELLAKNLTHLEMRALKSFPIFNRGRYKGGLIIEPVNVRKQPFKSLAKRTIGYDKTIQSKEDSSTIRKLIGLEGFYNEYLEGERKLIVKHLGPNTQWIPLYDASGMPERGLDIKTTINVHLQDIAEEALRKQLVEHEASYGCAIVMEVETGQIKAITNLSRLKNGTYSETFNHAIGSRSAPGSTQKIATLMALLEETNVSLNETVDIGNGTIKFYGEIMRDSGGTPKKSILTLKEVIENSSNVGTAKFTMKYFGNIAGGDQAFTNKFDDFLLSFKTGVDLKGEKEPFFRKPEMGSWSGLSMPWLSIGYESEITPLQTLAFYNAIANKGKYMRPYLVTDIYENNDLYGSFEPEQISQICSEETAALITDVLVGVVNNGTARNIKLEHVQLAGKTGTTKVKEKITEGYRNLYQASFAGFFPADNPKYSCVVVINQPSKGKYYGNQVAAPVFKDIAENFYLHRETPTVPYERVTSYEPNSLPDCKATLNTDLQIVLAETGIDCQYQSNSDWVIVQKNESFLVTHNRDFLQGKIVPNVRGMVLKDAVFILENYGLNVSFDGFGKVVSQSLTPGTRFAVGEDVTLRLQ